MASCLGRSVTGLRNRLSPESSVLHPSILSQGGGGVGVGLPRGNKRVVRGALGPPRTQDSWVGVGYGGGRWTVVNGQISKVIIN